MKSFKVTFDKNKSLKTRSGKVTIKKGDSEISIISITQSGSQAVATPNDNNSFLFDAKISSENNPKILVVTTNVPLQIGEIDFSESSGQDGWLTVSQDDAIPDDATTLVEKNITISVNSDNENENERFAKFDIIYNDENDKRQSVQIAITQKGKNADYQLPDDPIRINHEGGERTFDIEANVNLSLIAIDNETNGTPDWFRLNNYEFEATGVDLKKENYTVTIDKNPSLITREGKIKFMRNGQEVGSIPVIQTYQDASLLVRPPMLEFSCTGGDKKTLTIESQVSWRINNTPDWVNIEDSIYSGSGNKTISIYLDKNDSLYQRSVELEVEAGTESAKVSIIQDGAAEFHVNKSLDFTVKDSTIYLSVKTNIPVDSISIDKNGIGWLDIEPGITQDVDSIEFPIHADFNDDTEHEREADIYVKYMGPKNAIITDTIHVIQDRCPNVHEMKLDAANILVEDTTCVAIYPSDKAIHFTLGDENAKLEVNTANFDIPEKWKFNWTVDNEPKSNTNELDLDSLFTEKRAYSVKVEAEYEDDPSSLKSSLEFYLYPCPKCPDELFMKGDGSSGIMIADFNGPVAFENDYEYIFGYDDNTEDGTTRMLYYQYKEKDIVKDPETKKWVCAQWNIDATPIKSINRRYVYKEGEKGSLEHMSRSHSSDPTAVTTIEGEVMLIRGGRLVANVATPASAVIDIISVSGNTVRRMQLPSSTTFNEKIDFKGLSAGVYIVRCIIGQRHVEQKMVIK